MCCSRPTVIFIVCLWWVLFCLGWIGVGRSKLMDLPLKKNYIFFRAKHKFLTCSFYVIWQCSGYVAPEYGMQGHRSVKADVYSFGVLLLELLSGRKNLDLNLSHETQSLLAWVRSTVSNIFRTIQTMFFSSIYKLFSEVWNLRVMPFADLLFDTNIVITYLYLLRFAFEDKSKGWSLIQEYGFLHFEIWDNLNCLSLMSSRFHLWNWRCCRYGNHTNLEMWLMWRFHSYNSRSLSLVFVQRVPILKPNESSILQSIPPSFVES